MEPSDKHMKMKLGLIGNETTVVTEKMKIKMKLKMAIKESVNSITTSGEKLSEDAYEKLKMKLKSTQSAEELERMKLKMKQDKMQLDQSQDAMKLKMNMKLQTNDDMAKNITSIDDTKGEKMKMKMASNLSQTTEAAHNSFSVSFSQKPTKPPNVLIYAEDVLTRNSFSVMLKFILAKDLYTVYPLSLEECKKRIWIDNATLLVVCGDVNNEVTNILMDYLFAGGKLLCLCSNLLHRVLPLFQSLQVKDHEMVEVSFAKWEKINVMHRIYSNVSPNSVSQCVELVDSNGAKHKINLSVISSENTSNTPSILLMNSFLPSNGTAIFSQIHLETNPLIFKNDNEKFNMLLSFEKIRMSILSDLLKTHLELDVANMTDTTDLIVKYSRAFLIGDEKAKLWALESLKDRLTNDNILATPQYKIHFCGKDDVVPEPSGSILPLQIDGVPDELNFSTKLYYEELKTQEVGRLLIYAPLLTSSMHVLSHLTLSHGFCVIPRQQTQGTGRSKNQWLSPEGCAMFSMQLHVPLSSPLGQRITLVQHLVAVAIVHGIISLPGYNDLNIRLKWPNDIYANGSTKIGGLMINTSIDNNTKAILNIGCGINISNANPTVCINDLIQTYNARSSKQLALLEHERFFAIIFNEIESLFNRVQTGDFDYLYKLYYKYWLHGNAEVKIHAQDDAEKLAKVLGIDQLGYLMVQIQENIESVHPDGNSFDMLRGLIVPKVH